LKYKKSYLGLFLRLEIWYNEEMRGKVFKRVSLILAGVLMPVAAAVAREGTPYYYQNNAGQNYQYYQNARGPNAQPVMVGNQPSRAVVGQNVTSQIYNIPKVNAGATVSTPNGVALVDDKKWQVFGSYGRRFADFQFETGVQSILEWDDMVFDEMTVGLRRDFNMNSFDLFAFGSYTYGKYSSGGLSMDYDLKPYDDAYPDIGLFTISIGDQNGDTSRINIGIGAKHIWDVLGWKISPIIGYEIMEHNLNMSNHEYPNQATYIPLMTEDGYYVIGDINGLYAAIAPGEEIPADWYQVCAGPTDIALVSSSNGSPMVDVDCNLIMTNYDPIMGDLPWGVVAGDCVIIGGDGMTIVEGITHIYNTTWSGMYVGVELEKQMTYTDKLRFYGQVSKPHYASDGIWPNRTDWQQNPSFIDEGDTDAFAYRLEMEYTYSLSDSIHLALKADMDHFHIGEVPGTLFVAEYTSYVIDEYGQYVIDPITGYPVIETIEAHSETVQESLRSADWTSFGINLSVKYKF
jgi:hypothetical protein